MTHNELYIAVDQGVCTACGSCQSWSPDVFSYTIHSLGYNRLDNNTGTVPIPKELWDDVLPTTVLCPPRAIKFSYTPFVNFQITPDFGADSPDNPNITYTIEDNEWSKNELEENK